MTDLDILCKLVDLLIDKLRKERIVVERQRIEIMALKNMLAFQTRYVEKLEAEND